MVFTAHRPHPSFKETYFGYYKDDGFVKRKIQGRFDAFGRWDIIKEKWISNFLNRKDEASFSINKKVSSSDEWCAEAYMLTNYSILVQEDFESTLLNYASFLFSNKLVDTVSTKSVGNNKIDLDINEFGVFKLSDIFEITGSSTTPMLELEEYGEGEHPYVTTQATNNGVDGFYNYYTEAGGVLTVDSAVVGYCSYQAMKFSASDHVEKLIPKFEMNKYIALFLVTILNLENYRYNYGRKASQTRMKKIFIKLPQENGSPNFTFMEEYIKSLRYSSSL